MEDVPDAEFLERVRQLQEKVTYNIENYGVHLTGVFPTVDKPDEVIPFCYTAGMHEKGYPELIIAGLSPHTASSLLNDLAKKLLSGETSPNPGRISGLIKDYDAFLINISDLSDFTIAKNRAMDLGLDPASLQARQICWPDDDGNFPWDVDYDHDRFRQPLRGMQPLASDGSP